MSLMYNRWSYMCAVCFHIIMYAFIKFIYHLTFSVYLLLCLLPVTNSLYENITIFGIVYNFYTSYIDIPNVFFVYFFEFVNFYENIIFWDLWFVYIWSRYTEYIWFDRIMDWAEEHQTWNGIYMFQESELLLLDSTKEEE